MAGNPVTFPSDTKAGLAKLVQTSKALATATSAGGVAAIANPLGKELIITRAIVRTTTKSTAASTVDVGVAANATTSSDTLLDGVDLGTAIGIFDNITNKGTNGKTVAVWGASQFVTASQASGAVAGLVGELYVEYIEA